MNQGLFSAHINHIERILKSLDLFKERNKKPSYSSYGASSFRNRRYVDIWEFCYEKQIYDFLLQDDSLLQFRANSFRPSLDVNYVYYECPYIPKESFEKFFEQAKIERGEDLDKYELLVEEYELRPLEKRETVTPLRYDYSPELYSRGRHPASHIHFGYENNIRVGTRKILRPLSFTLFIIRQCYPDQWDKLKNQEGTGLLCKNISVDLEDVPEEYFRELDKVSKKYFQEVVDAWEMYLDSYRS